MGVIGSILPLARSTIRAALFCTFAIWRYLSLGCQKEEHYKNSGRNKCMNQFLCALFAKKVPNLWYSFKSRHWWPANLFFFTCSLLKSCRCWSIWTPKFRAVYVSCTLWPSTMTDAGEEDGLNLDEKLRSSLFWALIFSMFIWAHETISVRQLFSFIMASSWSCGQNVT